MLAVAAVSVLVAVVLSVSLAGVQGDTYLDTLLGSPFTNMAQGHRPIAVGLADLGGAESIGLLSLALAGVLLVRHRAWEALLAVVAPAASGALTQWVVKPLVDRPLDGQLAFPSGHATGTWALATVAVIMLLRSGTPRRVRWGDCAVVLALAAAVSVAVVAAQYHFATDVIGGAAVGIGVSCLLAAALIRWTSGTPQPPRSAAARP